MVSPALVAARIHEWSKLCPIQMILHDQHAGAVIVKERLAELDYELSERMYELPKNVKNSTAAIDRIAQLVKLKDLSIEANPAAIHQILACQLIVFPNSNGMLIGKGNRLSKAKTDAGDALIEAIGGALMLKRDADKLRGEPFAPYENERPDEDEPVNYVLS